MRYKIDPPEGYAPSSIRKNSKGSTTVNTANGAHGGEAFSHTNSVSTSQLHNTASGHETTGSKHSGDKRISSAPPNRHQKIYSRKVSVPKLFGELAHLDNELQVLNIYLVVKSHRIGSF